MLLSRGAPTETGILVNAPDPGTLRGPKCSGGRCAWYRGSSIEGTADTVMPASSPQATATPAGGYARPAFASVGVWKYSLSEAS